MRRGGLSLAKLRNHPHGLVLGDVLETGLLPTHNSWMHNAPLLMRGGRTHALRVHPGDATELGLEDGGEAVVESKSGALTVPVKVTDEMTPSDARAAR